jgi:DNA (cytosine-5)-methyltransferase 1
VDSMADTSSGGCAQGSLEGPRQALCTGARRTDADGSNWGNPDWLPCTDGKWRPVEPGTFPLAHGIPARVGLLRGYGNAIVPQVAAEFIKVCM